MNNKLDIIIPVYNEGANIILTLNSIFKNVDSNFDILICYDFEADDTLDAIRLSNFSDYKNIKFVKNISTGIEEELIFTEERVCELNISLRQKDKNTDEIYVGYSSPKTPSRVYLYNLSNKSKKLMHKYL